jgi:hypothetical protein
MIGVILIGVVVVLTLTQRRSGHPAYWYQRREVEQGTGEAA